MSGEQAKPEGTGLCNLEFLLVNLGRNRVTAERLIELYLQNYPVLCQRLQHAVQQDDRTALRDALHDIRSSCVLFSGQECVDQARTFEAAVRDESQAAKREEWTLLTASLCNCLQRMADELKAYLDAQSR